MNEGVSLFSALEKFLLLLTNISIFAIVSGSLANLVLRRRQTFLGIMGIGLIATTLSFGFAFVMLYVYGTEAVLWYGAQPFWMGPVITLSVSFVVAMILLAFIKPNTVLYRRKRR